MKPGFIWIRKEVEGLCTRPRSLVSVTKAQQLKEHEIGLNVGRLSTMTVNVQKPINVDRKIR